ncbi:MAG TPA: rhodanese-like domain-containing protein [Solirubrobacteraceae bacterium]|nr:rhodanese-like domain-containing protein [Solirubrobacteraceae bacterium]
MSEEQHPLEIDAAQAQRRLAASAATQLLDVREQYERDGGYIPGSLHIPLGELPARAGELDPEAPVIVYCRVGSRSLMAAQALDAAGFQATSLAGGIVDWAAAGGTLEPENGFVVDMERGAA